MGERWTSSPASSAPATAVRFRGSSSNGRWTGVPLKTVLDAGRRQERRAANSSSSAPITARKSVEFRTQKFKLDQQFGRSLPREKALSPEPFLAWALNGEPLTKHQGAPLRLDRARLVRRREREVARRDIHAQADDYLGKFQARWYRTLRERR